MHAQFITAEELLAQGEEENRLAKIEYERRHQDMATRLDAFLIQNPRLGYGGFETDSDWPLSRYDEVWRALIWLSGFKQRDTRPKCSSYYLKHVAERTVKSYISNGCMIAACALTGFPIAPIDRSPNASIGIPLKAVRASNAIAEKHATFADLVVIEPELKRLAYEARAYKNQSKGQAHVCANNRWYGYFEWKGQSLKERLCTLVGWESKNPILRNEHAYHVAYQSIYKLLPHCRNCNCYPSGRLP